MKQITLAIFYMVTLTSFSCMAQTHNGHEYVDLGLPSGTLWATCNVGATTPEGYGDYFAWGETEPKSNYDWSNEGDYKWGVYNSSDTNYGMTKYNKTDGKTTLDPEDDAATANWGGAWRMPTTAEQQELLSKCTWTWMTLNGVNGCRVTGSNGNSIFLPAAGIYLESRFCDAGSAGSYWSSSLIEGFPDYVNSLECDSDSYYWDDYSRESGLSVRPVYKNTSPDIEDEALVSFEAGGIYYNSLGGDSVEVTFKGESWDEFQDEYTGAVVIPATVAYNGKTYRVTAIADCTFLKCSNLTAITIPNSVTTIGEAAFEYCVGLAEVTISNSVTTIGAEAFLGCSSLTTITIPNSVTTISEMMFFNCNNLTEVILPNSVTTIEMGAFVDCYSLAKITLPNSLTTIGNSAFAACTTLIEITIPTNVSSIDAYAFEHCSKLAAITCLAITPPQISANTFEYVNHSIPLYVPQASVATYKAAPYWSEFTNIQAVVEGVEIVPNENNATITWSATAGASSYILTLYADMNQTEEIGTFTFDAQGQLTHSSRKKPTAAYNVEEDFSYTVTGLDANTTYFYVLNSCDATNSVLDSKSGQFTTTNTTAINDITVQKDRTNKVFENGTIYIRRNGEKYTVDGIRVM